MLKTVRESRIANDGDVIVGMEFEDRGDCARATGANVNTRAKRKAAIATLNFI